MSRGNKETEGMDYKGYTARVEFDQDAGILHGEVEGLRDVITFEATDVRDLEAAFRASVDDYLEQCEEQGEEAEKPYSGKFLVRVDPRLHRDVAMAAARSGKSLNAFTSDIIKHWIDRDRQRRVTSVPGNSNATASPERQVPLFPAQPAAVAEADSRTRVPVWATSTRNTPGSITPNTPGATRTPAGQKTKGKAA